LLDRAEDDRSRDDDMSGQAIAVAEVEPHKALSVGGKGNLRLL
jgi:hypothetical protein